MEELKLNILQILRSENIGSQIFLQLINKFKNNLNDVRDFIKKSQKFKLADYELVKQEYHDVRAMGGDILTYFDAEYPDSLKQISDPPIILSYIGDLSLLKKRRIAIIGSRSASYNSCNFILNIARQLAANDFIIVSGLAKGIDKYAHLGNADFKTIAVIASGVDQVYPKEHFSLTMHIRKNGLILSEYPFGMQPQARNFPRRNRIISGLSELVILSEIAEKSGSMVTARHAIEQNREIIVMPGHPSDRNFTISNQLIKDGANILTKPQDVFDLLSQQDEKEQRLIKDATQAVEHSKGHGKIYDFLSNESCSVEELAKISDLPISEILNEIMQLELADLIIRGEDNKIIKKY
jgi:DNA processing protein